MYEALQSGLLALSGKTSISFKRQNKNHNGYTYAS